MSKKTIITITSITLTVIIIAIAAVLIIYKNNSTTKAVTAGNNMSENEQLPTEEPSDEPSEEPEESPSPSASPKPIVPVGKYYIKVNTQANTVTIYVKDESGNYTIPVKAMVCSTGSATPKNSKYQTKGKWTWGLMFGGVYTQWETHITGNILFHSVPYLRKGDHNSLEYWEYNKLGTRCSAGCVRLTCADALWIYNNCAIGTTVEFYASSDPGPLGKPSAPKIPTDSPYKGWDPTDPHEGNPWRNVIVDVPSPEPSEEPTVEPTEVPSIEPSVEPTTEPTQTPPEIPTVIPSEESSTPPATDDTDTTDTDNTTPPAETEIPPTE